MPDNAKFGATAGEWLHFDLILGLTSEMLPVVSNPDAVISSQSKIKKLGKTPSIYNRAGKVAGLVDWTSKVGTSAEVDKWSQVADYGICIQTRVVRALDIDVPDMAKAERIAAWWGRELGIELP